MINDLRLQKFRSYLDESFEFSDGVNIIVGPNASGKTNLLEALQVVCLGGSYRARDTDLVHSGEVWARLDAHTGSGLRIVKLEKPAAGGRAMKTFVLGGKHIKRLPRDKTLPAVLFEPNHLQLLSGAPEHRRDFLDDLLEQTIADFGPTRRQYKRALAQRNALLKRGHGSAQQLFAWNVRLGELGGRIANERYQLIETFNTQLEDVYQQLSGDETTAKLVYTGTCDNQDYGSHLLRKLEASTEMDLLRGFTAYGPHRDDFTTLLASRPVVEAASRGEARTLLLSLKIIELKLVEELHAKKPILLLDDVFGELDGARRRALTEFLSGYQTFITTTDADVVVHFFMDTCHIIPLTKNK